MKKKNLFIVPLIIVLITFISCQKEPDASFTASKTSVVTGEVITFTNTSKDGNDYEWNFGDGVTSVLANPTYFYENAGTYNVEMTAYSKNGKKSDNATASITVTKANEIRYDGNKYPLTKGYLENYGDWDGSEVYYNFDVTLVDDGITITQDDAMGTGNLIYLELWSSSSTGLVPGTYTFADNYAAQTFSWGETGFNYNIATDIGTLYECTGGTVTISQSGTDYIFDVILTLATGKTVNAYYKGSLIYYDQTSKKSSKKVMRK
ncbi:MAG: PKD domain-containing protein [Bacteroidetes bacterium]|nr:PKD domain-containing protein [Bacteroidota bacterium]MBL7103049.1 PKD domain-containing protein [Bacteroidales bacterium]